MHTSTHAHRRISHLAQVVHLCFYNFIEVHYGSCNGESSGLSLLSVSCVSHELHARKILDEYYYDDIIKPGRTVDRALLSRALQLDFLGSHVLYSVS